MFSLIYGLWQYIFQKEELRILILGAGLPTPPPPSPNRPVLGPVPSRCYRLPSGRTPGVDKAGKTTLLERLKSMYGTTPGTPPERILPTVGLNVGRMQFQQVHLIFWDLGGQAGLRSIWDKYYAESNALIYLIDATDAARVDEAKTALERALGSSELYGAPLLVAANKQDCENADSAAAIGDRLGDTALRATRPCRVHGISAYTGQGIAEGLRWLVEEVKHTPRAQMLRQRTQYL